MGLIITTSQAATLVERHERIIRGWLKTSDIS